jgi:hypothetical protein
MKTFTQKSQSPVILMAIYTTKRNTPVTHSELDQYITTTDDWQLSDQENVTPEQPVYLRLFWSQTDSENWTAKRNEWKALYKKYINIDKCTTPVKHAVAKFIVDFHAFARPFLLKIKSCETALQVDADMFHVVLKAKKASHKRTSLENSISGAFSDAAPGKLNIWAKWNTEAKRASLPEGATHVEYSWFIVPTDEKGMPDLSDALKKMIVPTDDFKSNISTKAKFTMDLKADNSGKYAVIFLRWFVDFNKDLSSNYSMAYLKKIP